MTDEYIKKSYVANLIKDFCKDLIERKRSRVEITEFNADIQKKLDSVKAIIAKAEEIKKAKDDLQKNLNKSRHKYCNFIKNVIQL